MKTTCILALLLLFNIVAFAQSNSNVKAQAIKQLSQMKPALQKKYGGVMDEPKAIVGDINGDNRPDCVLSYVVTPKGGGNMILANVSTVFINTGKSVKNVGNIPEQKFCFSPKNITNQQIVVSVYTCAPPYNDDLGTAKFAYKNGKVVLVK